MRVPGPVTRRSQRPAQPSPARPGRRSGSRGRPSPAHRPPGSRSVERARSNEQGTPRPRHSRAVKTGRWESAGSTLGCAVATSGMLWNRGRAGGIPVLKPQRRSGQLFSFRSARETSILLRNVLLSSILLPFVFNRQTISLSVLGASRPGNFSFFRLCCPSPPCKRLSRFPRGLQV